MIDSGMTAWMLISASLVLLMTPGLAFFYGGMVRGKSVLNMLMMSFGAMGVIGILYVLYGWSMSYADQSIGGIFGNPFEQWALNGVFTHGADGFEFAVSDGLPVIVDVGFQVTFAMITTALISGAIADRVKYGSWLVFSGLWVTLSYFPLAHMVWGRGLLSDDGPFASIASPVDFAGGTVVHINAGIAALILVLIIGKRKGFGTEAMRPHNLPFVMLGAALLWFGWFGFNAGSAYAADGIAGLAWVNTTTATAAAMIGWLLTEKIRDGHATSLGAASGVVAGLVAITPAAGSLSPFGAIILGLIAGVLSALAVGLKYRFGYDDSLDVVGVHLVSGLWGTVGIGFLALDGGLFYGGGVSLLAVQVIIAVVAMAFSAAVTAVLALGIKATLGWRVSEQVEVAGIDLAVHGESAYETLSARAYSEVKP
ncbi:ammonium transporter [Jonesia denitrificans]|uniref:Ammonium transporter n=1 Tax=Jonesia denitrificans (strain ATCC 14870 / DSM 20603 / BCRC 15368 / CIP 55.134 / JCM 11481 / NBRC 15587 / NCTC 10816 / Prevot 55134) TaxID=471856 RepID=C7R314_JONDD|nr:ammonium transporter [Jonesia denitrificans]ACV08636.1 ammonium transporter [Jonesia denitrificans DSM 20603]ASE07749.1 ammonium transporter [Jonesia denitrificans]QXB42365.1 ammonium transporter [Jonesia denitrificans]SQH20623.1 Ammonia transporter [Jonesia denitrificans]